MRVQDECVSFGDTPACSCGVKGGTCHSVCLLCRCAVVSSSKSKNIAEPLGISHGGESETFLRRAMLFVDALKRTCYPNASTLARSCGCSRSTAVRTIDRLRYEFSVPIEYDEIHRGYYLTKGDFTLAILPPSREEVLVLCALADVAQVVGDASVREALEGLWARIGAGRSDVQREKVRKHLLFEPGGKVQLHGVSVVSLLVMCCQERTVRVRYRSLRSVGGGVDYVGRFERIRVAGGSIHVLFVCADGERVVLNAAFIDEVRVVHGELAEQGRVCAVRHVDDEWYAGHGSWSGAATELVEVAIAAPASRYHGTQVWHAAQVDSWDGETLVRRFPSTVSAELAARLLGLGRAVVSVRPVWVLERLRVDVANLRRLCSKRAR